jgi:uncharacterized cupin superfamily protein
VRARLGARRDRRNHTRHSALPRDRRWRAGAPPSEDGLLGGSLWEFQPGGSQFVYHFHHGSEELIIVLRGEPTVRLHDGDRQLHEGDVVPLPRGPEGGHQIRNDTTEVARVLIVSSNANPDVAEYPDTGKIGLAVEGADWEYHLREQSVPHAGPE